MIPDLSEPQRVRKTIVKAGNTNCEPALLMCTAFWSMINAAFMFKFVESLSRWYSVGMISVDQKFSNQNCGSV